MEICEFIRSYEINESEDFFELETDFEVIILRKSNSNLSCENTNLLRFIDPELSELFNILGIVKEELDDIHFLPSHIEKLLFDYYETNTIDPRTSDYLELTGCKNSVKVKVQNKGRKSIGTSFFKIYNLDDDSIKSVICKLVKELPSMRNHKVVLGGIPSGFGLFEFQNREKTKEPSSNHIDFWKLNSNVSNKYFTDVSLCFQFVN